MLWEEVMLKSGKESTGRTYRNTMLLHVDNRLSVLSLEALKLNGYLVQVQPEG